MSRPDPLSRPAAPGAAVHPGFSASIPPGWLLVIVAGGAVGTAARAALEGAFPAAPGTWPWTTFAINLTGSLLLGALLEWLQGGGRSDSGWRRTLRLGVGTGILGGYTTYSTFAVETVGLLRAQSWGAALGYAAGSVVLGLGSAVLGILAVRALRRHIARIPGGAR